MELSTIKKWDNGDALNISFGGIKNGTITISSDRNLGEDRTMQIVVKDWYNTIRKIITVKQKGITIIS